ncbi:hypothetical protein SMACR_06022 [Sordaria macrospora]|uniref:Rhodopsin domain-containing protein n=1 Tax=Sordaria macrospora TaxID=5147 RepID=A0A8S8ZHW9_SORMA|nr:hypothetical protein SMACR_06022 [Sordaria macrospora]WPJ65563.1 hypothetical protein SMAC4_06022 [Sordaria macrospora]
MTYPTDTDSAVPRLIVTFSVLVSLAGITMGFRFYCKHRYAKQLGVDDLLLGFSYLILLSGAIFTATAISRGFGQHIWNIELLQDAITSARIVFSGGFFVFLGIAVAKASICLTLYNIARKKWQRWSLVFVAVSVLITKLLSGIFIFVSCTPVQKRWNPMIKGTCWDINVLCRYWSFSGAWSAVTDLALVVLPWSIIWHLQVKRTEKILLGIVLSLGLLTGIVAAIKTTYIKGSDLENDFTYAAADLVVWESAELGVAIIAISIPFGRLAVQHYFKKKRAHSAGNTASCVSGTRGTRLATSESTMVRMDGNETDDDVPLARRQTNPKANDAVRPGTVSMEQFSLEQFLREAPEMPGTWRESGGIMLTRELSVGRHRRNVSDEELGFRAWSPPPPSNV